MNHRTFDRIGKYEIEEKVGEGKAGVVYRATHEYTRRTVALKVLDRELAVSEMGAERFHREVSVSSRVDDDGLVEVYDAGTFDETYYFAMELLEGDEFGEVMDELDADRALRHLAEAAETLAACHEAGVIHRDLKPANIFLTSDESRTKILDFGIASVRDTGRETQSGYTLGTPYYMSPEQARDVREARPQSDIWSLGVITYELITGEVPFPGSTATNILMAVIHDPPRPIADEERLPAPLSAVLEHALNKDPTDRYPDARDLADDLRAAADRVGGDFHLEPGPVPDVSRPNLDSAGVESDASSPSEPPESLDDPPGSNARAELESREAPTMQVPSESAPSSKPASPEDRRRTEAERKYVGGIVATIVDSLDDDTVWGVVAVAGTLATAAVFIFVFAPGFFGMEGIPVGNLGAGEPEERSNPNASGPPPDGAVDRGADASVDGTVRDANDARDSASR